MPLKKTYSAELEKLKLDYTKAGDLQSALAVDAELRALTATAQQAPSQIKVTADAESINSKKEFQKAITGAKWKVTQVATGSAWGVWEFKEDGTINVNRPRKWTVKDKRTIIIDQYEAKFSDDLKTFEVQWGNTGDLRGVLEATP
jgi:hypothetical protein